MDKMSTVLMDVPTRWNSTYTMPFVAENVQFVEYFEKVDGLEKKKRVEPPMEKDWEKTQVFVNFLNRFHDTTLQLSATKKTTSPLIWEEIVAMRMIIDETILGTTDPSLQEVAKRMENKDLMDMYKNDPIKLNYHLKMAQLRKAQKQAKITNEVDKYFSDPFVKRSSSFDILEWWKGNTMTFPVLFKIAKDIFSMPSSTVANENVFSLGRRVVDPFRASLHPKMVEALVTGLEIKADIEENEYHQH
ncbi:hypothetical protein ZIOFF_042073 [Zingiber officinale]|uniref:HAT C-terminal dimerisation domain-containing protein n=1 Tax=Zingiber officinale TaxID=94328 RepID=A0A8J5GDJ4_ZINOF|nr:hypothetical protein ZIOFF_042073 [Zingiber officinale]